MTEVYEHNPDPKDHEDPLPGPTWMIGFIGVVLFVIIVLGVAAVFYDADATERTAKVTASDWTELVELRAAQETRLEGTYREQRYEGAELVQALVIPIEEAMEAVVEEYGQP
jgi:hypothetical protein